VGSPSRSLSETLRRGARRLARRLRGPYLELVYSELYQLDLPGIDAQRGERILSSLDSAGLLEPRAVHRAEPAPLRELRRVHTDDYLDSLARPDALLQVFGLELPEYAAERALSGQRAMVGGTQLATRLVLVSGGIAANLGGGLHHAFGGRGERFCIFNDVAVAIAGLRAGGFAEPILVVDLDVHDDDGTRSIFAGDRSVYTFSIHNHTTGETPPEAATVVELGDGVDDRTYLEIIGTLLPRAFAAAQPHLVYYLAGCDPAADDAIGGWKISAAGMLRRDRMVIELARRRERRLPVVILLAGGYGQRAWRYSARFLSSLRPGGRSVEPPTTVEVTLARYRRLARESRAAERPRPSGGRNQREVGRHGRPAPLPAATPVAARPGWTCGIPLRALPAGRDRAAAEPDWELTAADVQASLPGPQRPQRLLGTCSRQQLELHLERAGLLERLRQLGFSHPAVAFDLDHPAGETVRVYAEPDGADLVAELRLRIDRLTAPGLAMLRIEWLLLQNPYEAFTPARPRLPGQEHPGLGLLRDVVALLLVACERLQLDGLLWVPAHYSAAAQGRRTSRFLHPADEGLFRALEQALAGRPLAAAASAVDQGRVLEAATGTPFVWHPMPVVVPASERLRQQLDGEEYQRLAAAAAAAHAFRLAPGAVAHREV
jgi:acetoin utilization deacetylase AcuC-like enzyme